MNGCKIGNSTQVALFVAITAMVAGCQINVENDQEDAGLEADASGDVYEPPVTYEWSELEKIYKMSPEETNPPTEPTNRVAKDPRAVQMGQFLFFDKRLSKDGSVSCATCHIPDQGFTDNAPVSSTSNGTTHRNTPTLLNVGYNNWYFWDGRTDSLWSQAVQPMEAFNEMSFTRLELAHLVAEDPELAQAYEDLFGPLPDLSDTARFPAEGRPVPEDPTHPYHQAWESMDEADQKTINTILTNVTKTLSAYQLQLVSLDAPFDTFVEGLREEDLSKQAVLSDSAQRGLKLFLNEGRCASCHQNKMFATNTFHNVGLERPAWSSQVDLGRYNGTASLLANPFNATGEYSDDTDGNAALRFDSVFQADSQKGQFRTAPLRNIARTAPYMHAGQLDTLEDVIRFYAELDQEPSVGRRDDKVLKFEVNDDEVDDMVAFLESLTGEEVPQKLKEPVDSPLLDGSGEE